MMANWVIVDRDWVGVVAWCDWRAWEMLPRLRVVVHGMAEVTVGWLCVELTVLLTRPGGPDEELLDEAAEALDRDDTVPWDEAKKEFGL